MTMPATSAVPLELEEHLNLCDWLNKHGVFFIHIPNEGQRSIQQAVLLKRMGMKKGAPDFIIPGPENIAIELKRCKKSSSRVSKEQNECLKELRACGWNTFIAYGCAEAINFLMGRRLMKKPLKKIPAMGSPGSLVSGGSNVC